MVRLTEVTMKKLLLLLPFLLVGCGSNQKSQTQKLEALAVQEDKIMGDSLPDWVSENETMADGRIYNVGYAEMSADKSEVHIKKAALMDAEVKLISEAPADFRVLTQNALVGAGIDSSEYMQIQTKLQELIGAGGFKTHESTCRKIIRYGETSNRVVRGCYQRASTSVSELRKAIFFTLSKKYGDGKAKRFDNLMEKELDKIDDQKRFDKTESLSNVTTKNSRVPASQE